MKEWKDEQKWKENQEATITYCSQRPKAPARRFCQSIDKCIDK